MKPKRLGELFLTFFKIGAFTFGGGYAMIPLIQKEVSEKKRWVSEDDILNIVAVAESTPGPIAINAATFIGYRTAGVFGAAAATLGVVLPSFVIISVIAMFLTRFRENRIVSYAFYGIRAGVLALVIKALVSMYKKMPKSILSYVVAVLAFILAAVCKFNVLVVILSAAVIGLVTTLIAEKKGARS